MSFSLTFPALWSSGRSRQAVADAHIVESSGGVIIEKLAVPGNERNELLREVESACHPLEVAPPAVRIRPVQLAARKRRHQPTKQPLVSRVHAEGYVWLSPIPSEVPLSHKQPDEKAYRELIGRRCLVGRGRVLFDHLESLRHYQVCCFTVRFLVEHCSPSGKRRISRLRHDRSSPAHGEEAIPIQLEDVNSHRLTI
ncbi:hypothetical protein BH24CHL6_BH24CHL6_06330 [soil metagenome]